MNMKHRGYATMITKDKERSISYKKYPDWKDWLNDNHDKFFDGRIKAGNPSFYRFLTKNRILNEAQAYLKKEWGIEYVRGKIHSGNKSGKPGSIATVRTDKPPKISREELVDRINEIRAKQNAPPLVIIEKQKSLE